MPFGFHRFFIEVGLINRFQGRQGRFLRPTTLILKPLRIGILE